MVFGFGFNKAKVLASAERNVKQGKLQNAIADYEKVLNLDAKDLTVMNTVGDLYARVGNTAKATEYFRKLGELYARDGFTVRAIAVYKKLTKQDPAAIDVTLKLGELYTQQGLYNDARAQFLHVAEHNLRNKEKPAAAKIFQKILELDPENIQLQGRLAALYSDLGRTAEARDLYFRSAEAFRARGSLDLADDALDHAIKLDPKFSQAIQLRAAVKLESGNPQAAADLLEQLPDIDSRPEALRMLLKAMLDTGNAAEAEPVARKLLRIFNDPSGIFTYADSLAAAGSCEHALLWYREHADRLLVSDTNRFVESLQATIARVKSSSPSLEILVELFQRAGSGSDVVEVTELLAHAYVQEDQLAKACELYKKLVELEPENSQHSKNYQQVAARLGPGNAPHMVAVDDAPKTFAVEEIRSGAQLEQDYAPELADSIEAAITDSELFDSYNLAHKAIPPLEAVLPQAPDDVRLNQRLASLYARAGRLKESADRCRILERVYREAGYDSDAAQFHELADRYAQRSGPQEKGEATVTAASSATEPVISTVTAQESAEVAVSGTDAPAAAPEVAASETSHEFDLSDEWDQEIVTSSDVAETATPASDADSKRNASSQTIEWHSLDIEEPTESVVSDLLEEIRFYSSQSMWSEARSAISRLEALAPGSPELAKLRATILPAPAKAPAQSAPVVPASTAARVKPTAAASDATLGDFVLDLESSLGDDFALDQGKPAQQAAPAPAAVAAAPLAPVALAAAASITVSPVPEPSPAHAELASAQALEPAFSEELPGALSDVFAEFKESMEAGTESQEDPETHYNLGVAFKEMGLLDEAIGELQKVCQCIERGQIFPQAMQAYTWLADCFLQQGVPEAAVRWYEKALKTRHIDGETATAIHYELACAHEAAGNRQGALSHFMEVYGSNIDYRDVAERIKALKS